jgi:protein-L-isoaspartate(D-aspartate) O-methyltransferase
VPDRVWVWSDGGDELVSRQADPDRWLRLAYANDVIAIQYDDGATEPGQVGKRVTSSVSMPEIVFDMLDQLDVHSGHRVLEIGAGSGWNAGLLCARLGAANVTTIEIDRGLAAAARRALAGAGFLPRVVVGDGEQGYAPNGPYDRIIATAAVQNVPYAWVEQVRPGGVIVTPWGSAYDNGALLKLVVGADGIARGRFVNHDVSFMWVRAQRVNRSFDGDDEHVDDETVSTIRYEQVREPAAALAIGLRVPGCWTVREHHPDPSGRDEGWFLDDASGSWAQMVLDGGDGGYRVRQGGPRRLWTEIADAYRWWEAAGRPDFDRYEITVSPDGQTVSLGNRVPNDGE